MRDYVYDMPVSELLERVDCGQLERIGDTRFFLLTNGPNAIILNTHIKNGEHVIWSAFKCTANVQTLIDALKE